MDLGLLIALIGTIAGVAAVVVGWFAWRRPKAPAEPKGPKREVLVEVAYSMPLYDLPDGSQEFGKDMVSVTVRNGTNEPVKVNSWGVRLPGNRTMVVLRPTTSWEPRLPVWVKPGDDATWFLSAEEVRRQAAALGCSFDSMIAYVSLADGREIKADRGMPLK